MFVKLNPGDSAPAGPLDWDVSHLPPPRPMVIKAESSTTGKIQLGFVAPWNSAFSLMKCIFLMVRRVK